MQIASGTASPAVLLELDYDLSLNMPYAYVNLLLEARARFTASAGVSSTCMFQLYCFIHYSIDIIFYLLF